MEAGEIKLSWTKIGVACTTILNVVTFASQTDWRIITGAVGLHAITSVKHEAKRYTETP